MKTQAKSAGTSGGTLSASRARSARTETAAMVDPQTRQQMIEEAAFYIAEKRGFQGGSSMDDWLTAETQIDAQIMQKH